MEFDEAATIARRFATQQGYPDMMLELEGGDLDAGGRWVMKFRYWTSASVVVTVDDKTGTVVGLKRTGLGRSNNV